MWQSNGGLVLWSALLLALAYGDALWLPFFFDDFVHLPYVDDYSLAEMWRTAGSLAYYRPLSFSLWKIMHGLVGYHSPLLQHGANLLLHGANGWLAGWLAGRLWARAAGPDWGRAYLSAAFFLLFPFSYQAVPWVGSMSHLLVTGLVLLSLSSYWWARQGGGRAGYLISLVAAALAPFAHENGVLVGPLLVCLEVTSPGGWSWRRIGRVALWALPAALWLPIWWGAPKAIANEVGVRGLETIQQNTAYFAQGIAYPLTWIGGWLLQRGLNDMVAAGLLSGLALSGAAVVQWWGRSGRRGLLPWLWVGLALLPAVLFLSFDYVINGPRLLMVTSVGAAWLWADVMVLLAEGIRINRRACGGRREEEREGEKEKGRGDGGKEGGNRWRGWVVAGLCLGLLAQNLWFIRGRMGLYELLAEPYRQAIENTVQANEAGRPAALVNLPSWVAPPATIYALGHEGVLFWPAYATHDTLVAVTTGQEAAVTLVRYEEVRPPMPYAYGVAGRAADWPALAAGGARFWAAAYDAERITLRPVGELPYARPAGGPLASFLAGEGQAPAVSLLSAQAVVEEEGIAISLTWQVATPPPAGVTVFVHLVDEQGQLVAQADGDPLGGIWPLAQWPAGLVALDRRWVAWDGSPPGAVYVGLYSRETGARWLAVQAGGERWVDEAVRVDAGQ